MRFAITSTKQFPETMPGLAYQVGADYNRMRAALENVHRLDPDHHVVLWQYLKGEWSQIAHMAPIEISKRVP